MADAISLISPSPGLSETLFPNKHVEPYSPNGPENVKKKHYIDVPGIFLEPPHGTKTAVVISK